MLAIRLYGHTLCLLVDDDFNRNGAAFAHGRLPVCRLTPPQQMAGFVGHTRPLSFTGQKIHQTGDAAVSDACHEGRVSGAPLVYGRYWPDDFAPEGRLADTG